VWRPVSVVVTAVLAVFLVREAVERYAFGLWEFERRFRLAGEYVASRLPQNALVITAQESGSVRFYSGRSTLNWRGVPADGLDQALAWVRARGYRPYLLIETGEQPEFVQQFEGKTPLAGLGWPPLADINHMLRIYDPDGYPRYRQGIPTRTDRVWTTKKRNRFGFRF
jgi:hypothetical protein